ncbi:MAG: ribosome silencing factor [Candidatus Binatia bacterium]
MSSLSSWERVLECTRSALDKKAYDLVVLDTAELTSIADYFIICSGRSDTQVQAIADAVGAHLESLGVRTLAIEGYERGQWALLDFGDVVVHVFYVPVRGFYDLERLWARAPRARLPEPFHTQARSLKTGTEHA